MNMMEAEAKSRQVGGSEYSWCRGVPGGTGIAVLAILTTKNPEALHLQNALKKLQNFHPILRSRLQTNPSKNNFSFVTSSTPFIQIKSFNLSSTCKILENVTSPSIPPLQLILEHELNNNVWCNDNNRDDLFFASTYSLPNAKWVVVLRLHVSACDRTTAVSLLRELLLLLLVGEEQERNNKVVLRETGKKGEVSLPIEDLIPSKKATKKGLWTRGFDMLGYSLNSLGSTNLKFVDIKSPRCSQVVRFRLNKDETERIILGCRSRGIKLCGALAAAGLIAAQSSRGSHSDYHHQRKYAVATLIDCRSILEPPLSAHHFGFYHSVIMNTHIMRRGEKLWDLAKRMYMTFANSKKCNKHFIDMADLNFLMCKAIQNPSLTPSSSSRTSLMSVFEDTVVDDSTDNYKKQAEALGVEDYIGCASVHGLGPSIALFDTIRDGRLDCACVYPSPLHSREQMQVLVENMKTLLVDADN